MKAQVGSVKSIEDDTGIYPIYSKPLTPGSEYWVANRELHGITDRDRYRGITAVTAVKTAVTGNGFWLIPR